MIDRDRLHNALRKMGAKHVKEPYRHDWTLERPTTGYCYVVAEVVYHYLAPKGSQPYRMQTGPGTTHWYIKDLDGNIVDLTADQFDEPLDYAKGKPWNFKTKEISKRGRLLADLLELSKRD